MEVQLRVPVPIPEFNFDSPCSSSYLTAPSSPQRFGNYFFSAPTTPTRSSRFLRQDTDDFSLFSGAEFHLPYSPSAVPFNWEEKPGIRKHNSEEFEFEFSGDFERLSLSAEELFDGGKIRPLRPPPSHNNNSVSPPRSPRSRIYQGKKLFQEALRRKNEHDVDPFSVAIEETRKRSENCDPDELKQSQPRGREKIANSSSPTTFNRTKTRSLSLSPLRVTYEEEGDNLQSKKSTISSVFSFSKTSKKWRFKDFLLFRSASEGRATSKDPLMKYVALGRKTEDIKNASFRSTDSTGSPSMRRGPVSAHEVHYTVNRAATEEMKKKTFLPYKPGLLGCLGFNPGMHEISRGIGSLTRG